MVEQLKMQNLHKLDEGRLAEAFNAALRTLVSDLEDRAGVDKARKLQLTFTLTPTIERNELSSVSMNVEISSNVPKVGSPQPIVMKPRKGPDGLTLVFNDECSENPDQKTFTDLREPPQAS